MIRYNGFSYAAAPRTASTWILNVLEMYGIHPIEGRMSVKHRPWLGTIDDDIRITVVRHPFHWLKSYYFSLLGGHVDVPAVDEVFKLPCRDSPNFRQFLSRLEPGMVGTMFASYRANTVIRMEDLPWCLFEFLSPLGFDCDPKICKDLKPLNPTRYPDMEETDLIELVVDREESFCETYEYW